MSHAPIGAAENHQDAKSSHDWNNTRCKRLRVSHFPKETGIGGQSPGLQHYYADQDEDYNAGSAEPLLLTEKS